jgi:nucleoside-diphosphate-sugar epimerase
VKVVVTGATGFVGAHTAAALHGAGHELRLLVRDPAKAARVGAAAGFPTRDLVMGDITDRDVVARAVDGADAVVHAAGSVTLDPRHAAEARTVNVDGTAAVLRAAVEAGLDPVVHVSSTSALDPFLGPLTAESPVANGSGYAASKAGAEELARQLQAQGAPVRISYPAGVIGPAAGESLGETSTAMARFVAAGVLPTPDASLSLIDVRDVAEVHARLLGPDAPARVVCGGTHLTMHQLGEHLRSLTGRRIPVLPVPAGLLRALGRLADRVPLDLAVDTESMEVITTWPGTADNAPADLGLSDRPITETLEAALEAWLTAGLITPRQAGRLAHLVRSPEAGS